MDVKEKIDISNLPKHIAIIMDGNGRWAKQKSKLRVFGHKGGVQSVNDTVEAAAELGIKFLTLYAFSTENWSRPKKEVNALMNLLVNTIEAETKTLIKNDIKLISIGEIDELPEKCKNKLKKAIKLTENNKRMTLILALSCSSRNEIISSIKNIATAYKNNDIVLNDINENLLNKTLNTKNIPDPELLIRTSGEYRISNFLLWQIAYSELYFTDVLWPDFKKNNFYNAIFEYQNRERRFGKTSEQILNQHE